MRVTALIAASKYVYVHVCQGGGSVCGWVGVTVWVCVIVLVRKGVRGW